MHEGWFLIETSGDAPTVLMVGSRTKQWRPVSNVFRGSVYSVVQQLVETVMNNLKQSQVLLEGPRLALAHPVLGPARQVHAILMWIGDSTVLPPPAPRVHSWAWDLADRVSPILVDDPEGRTMTDWLSGCARIGDVLCTLTDVRRAELGDRFAGEWVRVDGVVHRYALRSVATFDGPRLVGVSVELPEALPAGHAELLPRSALEFSCDHHGTAMAVVDGATRRAQAWLTDRVPGCDPAVRSGRSAAPPATRLLDLESIGSLLAVFECVDGSSRWG
ncbi:hypothetical protein G4H71_11145 [Rhodococcus triatomae]|uniref:Rv3651-like N-terminal domain-containing protein n=1 Tax=Rhodococcus triatomae TaxID=300028 RepID=A0A1G8LDS7_9NOCA|nr:GAF domain-containing protein [Rhodococcus triatomae]QNG20566.1 hypothetical protein G4H72_19235 [Rhodococcus triatomae]QNG23516.1 hypothetical protein G4H71_11145 [Rhodococcus triatomae]SDI53753.1 hypothetical protein SAMN05444695_108134 [Rhodococcus triatomae]